MFCNKVFDIYGLKKINKNIKIKLYNILIGMILRIVFLLLILSDINLLIPVDNDNVDNVINKLNVGNIAMYKIVPFSPMLLVKNILIIIANIFVIAPPNIRIMVDLINLFFIVNFMKIF